MKIAVGAADGAGPDCHGADAPQSFRLALNEWGRTSLSPDRAPAGAKRLGNLLRPSRWTNDLPEELLRKGADRRLME